MAFFSFFHGIPGIEYRGLFASAYVRWKDWPETRQQVGIKESFAQKGALQIVITSLASSKRGGRMPIRTLHPRSRCPGCRPTGPPHLDYRHKWSCSSAHQTDRLGVVCATFQGNDVACAIRYTRPSRT